MFNKLIGKIWNTSLSQELLAKKVVVSLYPKLKEMIPDEFIYLEEIFSESEIEEIWENYKQYLNNDKIFPFIGTIGEGTICIGFGDDNYGKIYYFDFDFGCFLLDKDLDDFVHKLVNKQSGVPSY